MPEQKVVDYGQSDNYFGDIRLKETDVLHEEADVIVSMKNVHKTYLLGVEGIPALRFVVNNNSFLKYLLNIYLF